ncbi:NUDIX domain-containing protein [Altericroceibacterium xinjiangense]|uniref:NUDIX domain-containing protein n=1 Tax=Altericroceibacterium xinjiangense TaxID=762261 RepID=UPI000F7F4339|nr:NUDIX domain-containing protein [Altericroceibacterium xinjiangense]
MGGRAKGKERSAGVLLFRRRGPDVEVLLIKPGGPYWTSRDVGAWQIPKGLIEEGESPLVAAMREAEEELGTPLADTPEPLATVRQAGGKLVEAFALEQDLDHETVRSNTYRMEWPPKSGAWAEFPEVEIARWFPLRKAETMMLTSQKPLLYALEDRLKSSGSAPPSR